MGGKCLVVYDKFRHFCYCASACVVVNTAISQNGYELVQQWLRVRRQASCQMPFTGMDAVGLIIG